MLVSLKNKCLIAAPHVDDDMFAKSVVYITKHDQNGAFGFIINQINPLDIRQLFDDLSLNSDHMLHASVLTGGPVRPDAGFVIHTGQPEFWHSSLAVSENICLTTSKDILEAISHNQLSHFLFILGYSSWGQHQLEHEIYRGDWFICDSDLHLLFHTPYDMRWQQACDKIHLQQAWLSEEMGNA